MADAPRVLSDPNDPDFGRLCRECGDYAGTMTDADPRLVVSLARGLVHVACLATDVTPDEAASDPWAEARAHLRGALDARRDAARDTP